MSLYHIFSKKSIFFSRDAPAGARIDTLVAGIEEGKRSFLIRRKKPDGKSYASDIADKYGLSFDAIVARNKK